MQFAKRIEGLASAVFSEMAALGKEVEKGGTPLINLGIGSPDQPPAPHVKKALEEALHHEKAFGYTLSSGIQGFKEGVAHWYHRRFGVELDSDREVLSLMGSQDGLAHIYLAMIDPGDLALIPDPGYPIYTAGLLLAGGHKHPMPLRRERGFLPDYREIPTEVARRAKMMVLNYPNNPVAATADLSFFEETVAFAKEYGIMVLHDAAYTELAYDGYRPVSFLQVPGAKEVGVEFHSVSKTYNLAGCRLGFAVGNPSVIEALDRVKSNIDYGVFLPVQLAGIAALEGSQKNVEENALRYQRRRDVLVDGLRSQGWEMDKPKASMFVWAPLPKGFTSSKDFAIQLLRETGVLVIPGVAFGDLGEGYVRMALVVSEEELADAVSRVGQFLRMNG